MIIGDYIKIVSQRDSPAIIHPDGKEECYWNIELERRDDPVIINTDSTQSTQGLYWIGKLYRIYLLLKDVFTVDRNF